jgi:tRNA threonylcarbamoyladenosine biosynthesis protein TsaB
MNLLAIETATELCSVALWIDGEVRERMAFGTGKHSESVLPFVDELLAESGIARSQLDYLACGRGPGAFTGVRLAISVAQGLAFGLDRPLVPVSSLAALAQDAVDEGAIAPVIAMLDARMGEIYAGHFVVDAQRLVTPTRPEALLPPDKIELASNTSTYACGSGWLVYRDALYAKFGSVLTGDHAPRFPRARALAHLAARDARAGLAREPEFAQPSYLRDKIAFTKAERATGMRL